RRWQCCWPCSGEFPPSWQRTTTSTRQSPTPTNRGRTFFRKSRRLAMNPFRNATLLTGIFLPLSMCPSGTVGQDQGKQDKTYASAPTGFDAKREGLERVKL